MADKKYKNIKDLPTEDILRGGHLACAGCGMTIALKFCLRVLGKNTVIANPASCSTLLPLYPNSPLLCSWMHNAMENAAPTAIGIRSGLDAQRKDMNVICWAGDGSTYDMAIGAISFAAHSDENIIFFCYNNQLYGNTGGQWASSSPYGSSTTTTPRGKENAFGNLSPTKDIMRIMAAHGVYVATASISDPVDLANKIEKAKARKGFSYIEILVPCTTNWKFDPRYTVKFAREAVKNGMWPLFEIENGILTINRKFKELKPINDFLKEQGRFKELPEEGAKKLQEMVSKKWKDLCEDDGKPIRIYP